MRTFFVFILSFISTINGFARSVDSLLIDSQSINSYTDSLNKAMLVSGTSSVRQNFVPTPEAYSLMQYSEYPVSLYTGVPEISIPIYTIEVGNYKLPITLSYHASGIKVAQEASRVGLGWSLHAGGEITRVIQGIDDFGVDNSHKGFLNDHRGLSTSYYNPVFMGKNNDWQIRDIPADGEPDIFHYNFGEYSGVFYSERSGLLSFKDKAFFLAKPEDLLKIEYNEKTSVFTVTTPENIKYVFEKFSILQGAGFVYSATPIEWKPTVSKNFNPYVKTKHANPPSLNGINRAKTTWYLTKIVFPYEEVIIFEYKQILNGYFCPYFESVKVFDIFSVKNKTCKTVTDHDCFYPHSQSECQYLSYKCPENVWSFGTQITLQDYELKRIRWSGGFVDFIEGFENRKDLRVYDKSVDHKPMYGLKPLKEISVYSNIRNKPVYRFQFHHSYFWSNPQNNELDKDAKDPYYSYLTARLKLDSLSLIGRNGEIQRYKMGYDMSVTLPLKNSANCDQWGYYTGKDILSMSGEYSLSVLPYLAKSNFFYYGWKDNRLGPFSSEKWIEKGKTYSAPHSLNPYDSSDKAKAWVLTSLETPLSGRTDFKYECNRVDTEMISNKATMMVGGLRIVEIKSPVNTKKYSYEKEGKSTGKLLRQPVYSYPFIQFVSSSKKDYPIAAFYGILYNSTPVQPMSNSTTGYHVGYDKVSVETYSPAKSFVDEYEFHNEMEPSFVGPFDMGCVMPLNGKLTSHVSYSNNLLVKRILCKYDTLEIDAQVACHNYGQEYSNSFYVIKGYFTSLSQESSEERGTDGTWNFTRTNYIYNMKNFLPQWISSRDGSGKVQSRRIHYMQDLHDYYKNPKLLTFPVEIIHSSNGLYNKKEIIFNRSDSVYMPWMKFVFYPQNGFDNREFYDVVNFKFHPDISYGYNISKNRCMGVTLKDGYSNVVIWGYNNQYPIAFIQNDKIENSDMFLTLKEIGDKNEPSASDWKLLYSLREKYPYSQVTICEYEPLVGMTKQTAPTGKVTRYVYDGFGRLKETIEETEGGENVVNKYDYKYATEKK